MRRFFAAIPLLVLLAAPLAAHPHVFAKTKLEFIYSGQRCEGVQVTWDFDQMFSLSMLQPVDKNGNGVLDKGEVDALYSYGFKNLENYGYFILIRVGTRRFAPRRVEHFTAWTTGNTLSYRFFVPLDKDDLGSSFYFTVFDTTFYTDLSWKDDAVTLVQKEKDASIPVWSRAPNKDYPVYYNPRGAANDFTAYSKWAPGLETVWPEEIHVRFE